MAEHDLSEVPPVDPVDPVDAAFAELARGAAGLPFNRHLGVTVVELHVGRAVTRLADDGRLHNHLAGVHAVAELAPVELAGALAAATRLQPLLGRGYVPVLGAISARYLAPAAGELLATAAVGAEILVPALAAADAGERPRVEVTVELTDVHGTLVVVAELRFVYLDVSRTLDPSGGAGQAAAPEARTPGARGEESPDSAGQGAG